MEKKNSIFTVTSVVNNPEYNETIKKMQELVNKNQLEIHQELEKEYMKRMLGDPKPMSIEIKENEVVDLDRFRMNAYQGLGVPYGMIDRIMIRDDEGIKKRWKQRRIKRNLDEILD